MESNHIYRTFIINLELHIWRAIVIYRTFIINLELHMESNRYLEDIHNKLGAAHGEQSLSIGHS